MSNFIDKVYSTTFTNGLNDTQLIEEIAADLTLSTLTIDYATDSGLNKDEDADNVRVTFTTVPTVGQITAYGLLVDSGAHVPKNYATFVLDNQGLAGSSFTFTGTASTTRSINVEDADDTMALIAQPQIITNKTIDADLNTISNIDNSEIKALAGIEATKIADGTVTSTEYQYINSLTSNAQTQINNRIVGAGTVIDNAMMRFDSTTGLLVQQSTVLLDDNANMTGLGYLELLDVSTPNNPADGTGRLYKKTGDDGIFWKPDSAGNEIDLTLSKVNSILTTRGDVLIRDATEAVRLPIGPVGQFLYSDGTDTAWSNTTKRLNTISKDITISTSYTTSLTDNQILNITTTTGNDITILPDATGLPEGWQVTINNNEASTELLDIQLDDLSVLQTIGIGSSVTFALLDNATSNGAWAVLGRSDHNIVNVGISDTKFTSINDAIASITDASATNPYQIRVSPGDYIETPITMKSHVSIYSNSQYATNIIANVVTDTIVTGASNSAIRNVNIAGATGANGTGVYIDGLENFLISNCTLENCETLIKITATTASSPTFNTYITSNILKVSGNRGIWFDGTAITSDDDIRVILNGNIHEGPTSGSATPVILIEGPKSIISMLSDHIEGDGINGTGIIIRDGSELHYTGGEIDSMKIGVDNQNTGTPCIIKLIGLTIQNTVTSDLLISNITTSGSFSGSIDITKSVISSPNFNTLALDEVNNKVALYGELQMGFIQSDSTNVSDAINNVATGVFSGGELTAGTGVLEIDVESGMGYVETSGYSATHDGHSIRQVVWVDATLTLTASNTHYVYITNTAVVSSSTSRPDELSNILLGTVRTDSTTREFISRCRFDAYNTDTDTYSYVREILKNQYISGSLVTNNASRQLAISSGAYYSALTRFAPSGLSSPATFFQYSHTSGSFVFISATVVNNTQYDNTTNLIALTTSYYTKHAFYIVGDGTDERYMLVIGQSEFATQNGAVVGDLPTPPPWFNGCVTLISSFVMQEGVSTIDTVIDERPFLGGSSGGTTGISDHGNLIGLGDDDHTQYLLINGTRAMGGTLDMGTNAITNVGLVDGVTVSAHASRHLPNGADPLTTAAPLSNVTISSTNTIGTANSLSRSDHTHELTLSIDDISPLTTKGDIMVKDATNSIRLPVGTNGQSLVANSALASGLEWITAPDNDTTDHTLLSNIGTNTHVQIDTHISTGPIHVDHTAVLLQAAANSGLNVDAGTTAVALTAATRQLTMNINNLITDTTLDNLNDFIAFYDTNGLATKKITPQNLIDSVDIDQVAANYVTSDGEVTSSSNAFALKVSLAFTAEATTYIIFYSAEIASDSNNVKVIIQLEEDNTTVIASVDPTANSGSAGFAVFSGYDVRTLTAGAHTYDMDYRSSTANKTVRVRRARIFAMKFTTL
jgi:hypothetical protein